MSEVLGLLADLATLAAVLYFSTLLRRRPKQCLPESHQGLLDDLRELGAKGDGRIHIHDIEVVAKKRRAS